MFEKKITIYWRFGNRAILDRGNLERISYLFKEKCDPCGQGIDCVVEEEKSPVEDSNVAHLVIK